MTALAGAAGLVSHGEHEGEGDTYPSTSEPLRDVCRHCLARVTWETVTTPGYLPRTGWSDGRRDPFYCPRARDLTHVPSGMAAPRCHECGCTRELVAMYADGIADAVCCDLWTVPAAHPAGPVPAGVCDVCRTEPALTVAEHLPGIDVAGRCRRCGRA